MSRSRWQTLGSCLLALWCLATVLSAQRGLLEVHPASFELVSARARQPLLVLFTTPDGITRDVTAGSTFGCRESELVAIEDGVVRPLADGTTRLVAQWSGGIASAEVTVRDAASDPPISYRNDVVPILTRAGCNSGACHGAASGKNGFGLTLFGYDPGQDHPRLTRDYHGRRLDLAVPERSLMLTKPTGEVPHKGGKRLEKGGPLYDELLRWIAEGGHDDVSEAPALVALELTPAELVLAGPGARGRVLATARYADGSSRDVTRLAVLSSSAVPTAAVDDDGHVTAGDRGEAYVLARFGPFAQVAQVLVLADASPATEIGVAPRNEVDELVFAKLRKMRLQPAGACDDQTFVRRVHVDLLGRLPTADEVRGFLAADAADKRAQLVDALLETDEFAVGFSAMWEDVLRIEPDRLQAKGMWLWTRWLRESIRDRVPFDRVVHRMLTADGSTHDVPETNYWNVATDPKVVGENLAQAFLGIRVQCAQCHNHPFERWRMDDYYGFAAFFGQVGRKRGELPDETVVYDTGSGDVRNARDNSVAAPRFLGGDLAELKAGAERREALADWLVAPDNPWFAANVANRIWARLFGRGIVEPVDDVRVSNPPSHPALHRWLGERLAADGYDVRALIRLVCGSHVYQADQLPEGMAASTFAGREPRRMSAEQLLDAIDMVTGVPSKHPGQPLGARAVDVVGPAEGSGFLELFGRPLRETACACERQSDPTLNQVLHLINGATIDRKLRAGEGWLARRLKDGTPSEVMLEELFLAAYARPPRGDEREHLMHELGEAADPRPAWEDLMWAVLNSKEFLFQR